MSRGLTDRRSVGSHDAVRQRADSGQTFAVNLTIAAGSLGHSIAQGGFECDVALEAYIDLGLGMTRDCPAGEVGMPAIGPTAKRESARLPS